MRGTYRGEERVPLREIWRREQIPRFTDHEVVPLARFVRQIRSLTAIDGGANKGFWSKAMLDFFGERIDHIYMIDASPENYRELTARGDSLLFDERDFAKTTPIHTAISDTVGVVNMFTNDDGSPIGSMFNHMVGDENAIEGMGILDKRIEVPCTTIDNIIDRFGIERVDVLKLDIEGAEFNALQGAERAFAAGKIHTVLFEFGIHQVESRHFFRDFYSFFKRHGFRLYKLEHLGGDTNIPPVAHEVPAYAYGHEVFTLCWNFVATRG